MITITISISILLFYEADEEAEAGDDVYSRASSWRRGRGIEPFRWACNSALGRRSRKASWEGERARKAASLGPALDID